ncbi:MAG: sugar phosphate isomerase/epimerase [Chitinophagaceae bacterium]|jgi:sugar phosphate isomerase/epimerase|nr:sugar phosphate isomerase/epimerase [Chitinophagaceae bacterium]
MNFSKLVFICCFFCLNHLQAQTNWKLSVQMWTFHKYDFQTGLKKADSCALKFIEAYPGQKMGDGFEHTMGPDMSFAERQQLKQLLSVSKIKIIAFGVVSVEKEEDWLPVFEFCKDMNIPFITAEPKRAHLDAVNELAKAYNIKVAIHDHPKPSDYWHPDSVLAAIKGRPYIAVCADIGHWARNGLNVVECLQALKGKIWGLHLKDVDGFKIDAADVLFGTGVCDLPAVMAELKRQKFNGFLSVEHEANFYNNVPDVKKNISYYFSQLSILK